MIPYRFPFVTSPRCVKAGPVAQGAPVYSRSHACVFTKIVVSRRSKKSFDCRSIKAIKMIEVQKIDNPKDYRHLSFIAKISMIL